MVGVAWQMAERRVHSWRYMDLVGRGLGDDGDEVGRRYCAGWRRLMDDSDELGRRLELEKGGRYGQEMHCSDEDDGDMVRRMCCSDEDDGVGELGDDQICSGGASERRWTSTAKIGAATRGMDTLEGSWQRGDRSEEGSTVVRDGGEGRRGEASDEDGGSGSRWDQWRGG